MYGPEPFTQLMKFSVFILVNEILLHEHAGREKEAISDMLPYLRLGYVSDTSEMQSVISSLGPICPVSSSLSSPLFLGLIKFVYQILKCY